MRFPLVAVILLMGCHAERRPTYGPSNVSDVVVSQPMGGMSEGAACAGVKGLPCAPGLTCKMTGPPTPDQSGICRSP